MPQLTVLGAGTMGHGIAHAAIAAGYDTTMYDVAEAALDKGRAAIGAILDKGVELGKMTAADAAAARARLRIDDRLRGGGRRRRRSSSRRRRSRSR